MGNGIIAAKVPSTDPAHAVTKGLQNPYSSVRFRPGPPTVTNPSPSENNDLTGCCGLAFDRVLSGWNVPDFAPKWQNCGESEQKRWTEKWTAVHPLLTAPQRLRIIFRSRMHPAARRPNVDGVYQSQDNHEQSARELSPTLLWRRPEIYPGDAHGPDEERLNLDTVASRGARMWGDTFGPSEFGRSGRLPCPSNAMLVDSSTRLEFGDQYWCTSADTPIRNRVGQLNPEPQLGSKEEPRQASRNASRGASQTRQS